MTNNTDDKVTELNLIEFINLAANILNTLFIQTPTEKSKPIFKHLKSGQKYSLGTIKIQETIELPAFLAMDYSEFVGPGFNFDIFRLALAGILNQISAKINAKKELDILDDQKGSFLVHLPGIVKKSDQYNVMLMTVELGTLEDCCIKLMFVDPTQYDQLNKIA